MATTEPHANTRPLLHHSTGRDPKAHTGSECQTAPGHPDSLTGRGLLLAEFRPLPRARVSGPEPIRPPVHAQASSPRQYPQGSLRSASIAASKRRSVCWESVLMDFRFPGCSQRWKARASAPTLAARFATGGSNSRATSASARSAAQLSNSRRPTGISWPAAAVPAPSPRHANSVSTPSPTSMSTPPQLPGVLAPCWTPPELCPSGQRHQAPRIPESDLRGDHRPPSKLIVGSLSQAHLARPASKKLLGRPHRPRRCADDRARGQLRDNSGPVTA